MASGNHPKSHRWSLAIASSVAILLLALAQPGSKAAAQEARTEAQQPEAAAQDPNPGAAPPAEQLEQEMQDWHARKKRSVNILLAFTGITFVVIGVVRFRARARRKRLGSSQ